MTKPFHLFIVDDDNDDKEFFYDAVAKIDFPITCSSAANGLEALQLLSTPEFKPDFIFLDLNMPRMNGKQLLVHIKNDELLRSIPVVIFSTSKSEEEIEETKNLGAAHFMVKPSRLRDLTEQIANVINNKLSH